MNENEPVAPTEERQAFDEALRLGLIFKDIREQSSWIDGCVAGMALQRRLERERAEVGR